MATRRRRKNRPLRWDANIGWLAVRSVGETALGLQIVAREPGDYAAVAFETNGTDARSVFANHAHAIIGEFKTELGARRACQRYADKWEADTLRRCECGPIA